MGDSASPHAEFAAHAATRRQHGSTMPSDIDPESGFRLPLPKREDLDEAGKATYDRAVSGGNVAGLRGPAGVRLYSRGTTAPLQAILDYLRSDAGISPRIREIA